MCGRYTLKEDGEDYWALVEETVPEALRPFPAHFIKDFIQRRWQVAPGSYVPAILPDGYQQVHWWLLPSFAKPADIKWRVSALTGKKSFSWATRPPKSHFNTRHDTLLKPGYWHQLLDRQRCLIPSDGFIEWSDEELIQGTGQEKKTGYFYKVDKKPFFYAGIFDIVKDDEGKDFISANIITTAPNEMLKALPHKRMPAILRNEEVGAWMDPDIEAKDALNLIRVTPDKDMAMHLIGKLAGNARNNVPEVLDPI